MSGVRGMRRGVGALHLQIICNQCWVVLLVCERALLIFLLGMGLEAVARAQEPLYFVTYSDVMEEPGNLELTYKGIQAAPKNANSFTSATIEMEYGLKAYWTTEVYLSGQTTQNDSTIFTGYRWENRFRPLKQTHFINPVFYVEYEDVNAADRSFLEITGHQSIADLYLTNAQARNEVERALELKLILSSNTHGWNISENFIAEKALNESEAWEFGYALGVSRPLTLTASSKACVWCRKTSARERSCTGDWERATGSGGSRRRSIWRRWCSSTYRKGRRSDLSRRLA